MTRYAVCADVGSTYTKVAVVDLHAGRLAGTAAHPTTSGTDVLHGLDAAVTAAAAGLELRDAPWYVCSSAGGGLRLAVVGYEPLVTAEAGHRVGLSAGARVVHVAAGPMDGPAVTALRAARPDVVLLVGGTDGGDAEVLLHNATRLAGARWRRPVVVAGNADARPDVLATLGGRGVPATAADNVLPRIGELAPASARAAIREVFLRHVIGGKKLSRGPRFARLVRGATPDVVLTAVELLADHLGGDLLVVDVGGATTDVYSVLTPDAERHGGVRHEVAGMLWRARTVEGDLGVRWNAPGVVAAARAEGLLPAGADAGDGHGPGGDAALTEAAARRAADPGYVAATDAERAVDRELARLAAVVAVRRHARGETTGGGYPRRSGGAGRDLRDVRLVVGSGGALRHADPDHAAGVLTAVLTDHGGGWPLPRDAAIVVDTRYVLAAAGLLAAEHPGPALRLLQDHLRAG